MFIVSEIIFSQYLSRVKQTFYLRDLPQSLFSSMLTGLGADIIDSTNQNMILFGELQEEDTWFELTPEQKTYFDSIQHVNSYLQEEFHAVQNLLWKSRFISTFSELPKRSAIFFLFIFI